MKQYKAVPSDGGCIGCAGLYENDNNCLELPACVGIIWRPLDVPKPRTTTLKVQGVELDVDYFLSDDGAMLYSVRIGDVDVYSILSDKVLQSIYLNLDSRLSPI